MKRKISKGLLATGASALAMAGLATHAHGADNVAGLVGDAIGSGVIGGLATDVSAVNVFGAYVVSTDGDAKAEVSSARGDKGGAVEQTVEVTSGNGGARFVNGGDTTVQAIADASQEEGGLDVNASSDISHAIRQSVELQDGGSVTLDIDNENAFTVHSAATATFLPLEEGLNEAGVTAVSVIRRATEQHAVAGEGGNADATFTNAAGAKLTVDAQASVRPQDPDAVVPDASLSARSANGVALIGKGVDQHALGVDAAASVNNNGELTIQAGAEARGARKSQAAAIIVQGVGQDVGRDIDGEGVADAVTANATTINGGDAGLNVLADAFANDAHRADGAAVIVQGIAQNVTASESANATFRNAGSVVVKADSNVTATDRARAGAAVAQGVGQYVESANSTALINNSGSIGVHAIANAATTSAVDALEVADKAHAVAAIGQPHALLNNLLAGQLGAEVLGEDAAEDLGLSVPQGPLAGLSQEALGSSAEIINTADIDISAVSIASAAAKAKAEASVVGVDQVSQGDNASTSFDSAQDGVVTITADADATARKAKTVVLANGVNQNANGVTSGNASFVNAGSVTVQGAAHSAGVENARANATVAGVTQSAAAALDNEEAAASTSFVNKGSFNVVASSVAAGSGVTDGAPLGALVLFGGALSDTTPSESRASAVSTLDAALRQTATAHTASATFDNSNTVEVVTSALANGEIQANANAYVVSGVDQTVIATHDATTTLNNSGDVQLQIVAAAKSAGVATADATLDAGVMQNASGTTASADAHNDGTVTLISAAFAEAQDATAHAEIGNGIFQNLVSESSTASLTNDGSIVGMTVAVARDTGEADDAGTASATSLIGAGYGALIRQEAVGSTVALTNSNEIAARAAAMAAADVEATAQTDVRAIVQHASGEDASVTLTNAAHGIIAVEGFSDANAQTASATFNATGVSQMADGNVAKVALTNDGLISANVSANASGAASATASTTLTGIQQAAYGTTGEVAFTNKGTVQIEGDVSAVAADEGATATAAVTGYRADGGTLNVKADNQADLTVLATGHSDGELLLTAVGAEFVAESDIVGTIDNSGTVSVTARGGGVSATTANATGLSFGSVANGATLTNTGTIEVQTIAPFANVGTATGIRVSGPAMEEPADAVFTINNNGGTITARQRTENAVGGYTPSAIVPANHWRRGTAIDTLTAPNEVRINFDGTSSVYGNIEISGDDSINVRTGELTFEGVVNTDQALRGNLEVQGGASLYLVDPINRSAGAGYTYEGASRVNVEKATFNSNSKLALQLPTNQLASIAQAEYPRIRADEVNLAGTIELRLPTPNGLYDDYVFEDVIDANTRNGRFDKVVTSFVTPLLSPSARYDDANNVDIIIDRIGFGAVRGLTHNQTQTGNGIERVYNPNLTGPYGDLMGNLFRLGPDKYPDALDQLSGAQYAGFLQAVRNMSQQINSGVNDQLDCVASTANAECIKDKGGLRLFGMAGYGETSADFDGNSSAYSANGKHLLLGLSYVNNGLTVGAFGGYRDINVAFDRYHGEIDADGWQAGVMAGYDAGAYYLRGNASYGKLNGESERRVAIGTTQGEISGDVGARVLTANAELGLRQNVGKYWFTPFASIDHASVKLNGLAESGVPGANLTLRDQTQKQTSVMAGLKWTTRMGAVVPEVKVAYRHDFNNRAFTSTSYFSDAPVGSDFSVRSPRLGPDSALAGVALAAPFNDRLTGRIGYVGRFNGSVQENAVFGSLVLKFGVARAPAPTPPAPTPSAPTLPPPPPPPICETGPYLLFFDWNSTEVTSENAATLDAAVSAYANCGSAEVVVVGHADRSGPNRYNLGLSQRRADAVKAYMIQHTISESTITTQARGETELLVPTVDGIRNQQNRRVEIRYQEEQATPAPASEASPAPVTEAAPAPALEATPAPAPEAAPAAMPAAVPTPAA